MTRRRLLTLFIVVVGAAGIAGAAFLIYLNTGGDVSREISAPTLEPDSAAEATAEGTAAAASGTIFRIMPEQSEVRFSLDETLAGNQIVVTGRTDQVAGDVRVNFANPQASELGVIRINMRSLQTDNSNRDGAMRRFILRTAEAQYEFSDFVPTEISGLPDNAVESGQEVNFQVTGNFTLVDTTQPLTFDVRLTLTSDTQIDGYASTTLNRTDWAPIANFSVPPQVAFVGEAILLEIEFVAVAVTDE